MLEIEAPNGSDTVCLISPAVDHLLHPNECIVRRDAVSLLCCLNKVKDNGTYGVRASRSNVSICNYSYSIFH